MLSRNLAFRAIRTSRSASSSSSASAVRPAFKVSGRRYASSSSSSSQPGPNSMLVGAGLFSGVLVTGYVFGKLSERGQNGKSNVEPVKEAAKAVEKKVKKTAKKATSKAASSAPAAVPAAVAQKAEEADQSMPGGSSSDSSNLSSSSSSSSSTTDSRSASPTPSEGESIVSASSSISDPGSLSESGEAAQVEDDPQQAAFNPETGEINWDCPCLGGMAHGVCGEEFKAAFSCFVYSTEEPKGQDCIEKFRGMQECFRAHPDVYGEEVTGEEGEFDEEPEYDIVSAVEDALSGDSPKQ